MKQLKSILQSSGTHWVGNGFPVRSVFSYDTLGEELDPFLLLDYAAPYLFPPGTEKRGVGAHPHRGFETVTISYQGEIEHRDSSGGGGKIGPGDVQWMTAASGLLHEEFHSAEFTRTGGVFEMAQLWVNLPARDKDAHPRYQTLLRQDIPVVQLPNGAGEIRVISGTFSGAFGPAKTFTPINLWDLKINAGASPSLVLADGHTAALVILSGELAFTSGEKAGVGALAIFTREGEDIQFSATKETRLLVMSGEPLREPIVGNGPFVMNSEQEIRQAFADVRAGKMGSL
ncbi:pirin family protein [Verrucomicrobium sp. BvORR106]|uniref:pirin family protein n=1 Tax=Verrucomicrobium sp. BvORR106 TaxID=1403819 RepID=UPI0005714665|nr:pirin family protein [Verrucomicrobium sp. BvORR106]